MIRRYRPTGTRPRGMLPRRVRTLARRLPTDRRMMRIDRVLEGLARTFRRGAREVRP
jgi:hypothetical protein